MPCSILQEEKTAREAAEAERAELLQSNQAAVAELQRRLEDRLSAEESAHKATKAELADVEKQRATLSVQVDASKAQLQANSISSQKRQAQFEQQKGSLEARRSPSLTFLHSVWCLLLLCAQLGVPVPLVLKNLLIWKMLSFKLAAR